MNNISIELRKEEFTGGDTVEGAVLVQLDQDTPYRGIRLVLKGYEEASWREGSGKTRHTHSETRSFFDEEITLEGRPRLGFGELLADSFKGVFSKDNYEVLHPGTYRYPFSYVLPPNLPGEYESAVTNSRIYYGIKAHVDLPLKFDLKAEKRLSVCEPIPATAQEVTRQLTKNFLFDSAAEIEAAVHLERDTFWLGEDIVGQLEVMNRAPGKEIRAVTLTLRQLETACADGRTHEGQNEITRFTFDQCRFPVKERTTMELKLPIPSDLYPTIESGSLVKVGYELQIRLDIPWAVDAKLSVPIKLVKPPEQTIPGL